MHSGFIALSLCFAIVPKISEGEIKYELSMEKLRGHNEHLNGSCTGFPFCLDLIGFPVFKSSWAT